jgi:hypothetical protein
LPDRARILMLASACHAAGAARCSKRRHARAWCGRTRAANRWRTASDGRFAARARMVFGGT